MKAKKLVVIHDDVVEYAKTHTVNECAEYFKVTYSMMWNYAFDNNIKCKKGDWNSLRKSDRNKEIVELNKTYSYVQIGKKYGLTRQRVYQIVKGGKNNGKKRNSKKLCFCN